MIGLIALADSFGLLFEAIAADWETTRQQRDHVRVTVQPWTPERVRGNIVRLAREIVEISPDDPTWIHPEFTPDAPKLMGAWSY